MMTSSVSQDSTTTASEATLGYATPPPPSGQKIAASTVFVVAGLGLIVLGGCFLIGIMMMVTGQFSPFTGPVVWSAGNVVLVCVLYVMALLCFALAGISLFIGARGLFRVLRG